MEKLRILILDDSEIVLNMTSLVLSEAGFEVFTAASLPEFDKVLEEKEPDLILTDIKMPEISGDNVCRVLKAKFDTHMIPIVLFSTLDEEELSQLAERSGADGYVCKSRGMKEIVKRVRELTDEIVF